MPNGRKHKSYDDYGAHEFEREGTSDCKHGCGCLMGPFNSRGPVGIDPFGHCPNNPLDGRRQPGNDDYEDCVNGLINQLKMGLSEAREAVAIVEIAKKSSKVALVKDLREAKKRIAKLTATLRKIDDSLSSDSKEISRLLGELI